MGMVFRRCWYNDCDNKSRADEYGIRGIVKFSIFICAMCIYSNDIRGGVR